MSEMIWKAKRLRQKNKCFTLIELLVVVAIIGILASLLLPVLGKARQQALMKVCLSNEKQIALAMLMYVDDSNEYFVAPSGNYGWDDLISPYMNLKWDDDIQSKAGITEAYSHKVFQYYH